MLIIGGDFHARFQQIAMLDPQTGELAERRLEHENREARASYAAHPSAVRVGMEATGYSQWFETMLAEQGHELCARRETDLCVRVTLREGEEVPEQQECGCCHPWWLAFSGIQGYSSGTPMGLTTVVSFPIFNGGNRPTVTTYDGWAGTQSTTQLGNATRYNPKLCYFPTFNENISLTRSIKVREQMSVDFRWETFNLLNRTQFGSLSGGASLQNANLRVGRHARPTGHQGGEKSSQ